MNNRFERKAILHSPTLRLAIERIDKSRGKTLAEVAKDLKIPWNAGLENKGAGGLIGELILGLQNNGRCATADVALEVLGRGHEETGSTTSTLDYYGQWHTYPDTVRVVRVGLKAGGYTTLFEGTSSFAQRGLVGVSQGLWRVAASGAAKGIENWIRANHNTLLSKRSDVQTATIASREACIPDTRTPSCRAANAKAVEARLRQTSPDVRVSVEGPNSDTLVEASGQLFDDPVIRDPTKRKELEKALCVYAYKRVVVVNPSNLARYEFEVNCSTNPPASNSDSAMMPRPEPAPIPQEESGTGWIGITTTDDSVKGVVITRMLAGSPAERARLQVGDVIEKMDGVAVESGMEFDVAIAHCKPGSQIRIGYMRGAWKSEATVTVGKIE